MRAATVGTQLIGPQRSTDQMIPQRLEMANMNSLCKGIVTWNPGKSKEETLNERQRRDWERDRKIYKCKRSKVCIIR